jgi:hypothetical protein
VVDVLVERVQLHEDSVVGVLHTQHDERQVTVCSLLDRPASHVQQYQQPLFRFSAQPFWVTMMITGPSFSQRTVTANYLKVEAWTMLARQRLHAGAA